MYAVKEPHACSVGTKEMLKVPAHKSPNSVPESEWEPCRRGEGGQCNVAEWETGMETEAQEIVRGG